MKKLLLHERTAGQIEAFIEGPAHALILSGPSGSGKSTLAAALAEAALELTAGQSAAHPYVMIVRPEEGKASIGIETIRELDHFFSLRVPVQSAFNRAVIVEDAHLLTLEAQNALLKILEEPPDNSLLILAAASEQSLLPTLRSRSQTLEVVKPAPEATETYFGRLGFGEEPIKQAYAISGGLPGLMNALLNDEDHPLKQATEWARRLLSQSAYERLLSVDELAKNKRLAADTAFILQQMAHVSLRSAQGKVSQKWQKVLKAAYEASEELAQSAQPKLVLANLMLSL